MTVLRLDRLAAAVGACYGAALCWIATRSDTEAAPTALDWVSRHPSSAGTLMVLPPILWIAQREIHSLGTHWNASATRASQFAPHVVFVAAVAAAALDRPRIAFTVLAITVWLLWQVLVQAAAGARGRGQAWGASPEILYGLFFLSGFSALIYQVAWQRILFAAFGVDTESVVVIVSVFMLGLGVGSLAGAVLLRWRERLLEIFLAIEFGIGAFGLASTALAAFLQTHVEVHGHLALGVAAYALFAVPTLLMGATLPVLVGFLERRHRNIGRSTGLLYAANTLGSALAAFLTVSMLFPLVGLRGATWVAAMLNFVTAFCIYVTLRRLPRVAVPAATAVSPAALPYGAAVVLALLVGFVALGQELIWFRLLAFSTADIPQVFGFLLAATLRGMGSGAFRAARQADAGTELRSALPGLLARAAVLLFFSIPLVSLAAACGNAVAGKALAALVGLALAVAFGSLTGGVLPALCSISIGSAGDRAALRMTGLYFANIVGAACGPLIVGYWLFDHLRLEDSTLALGALLLVAACAVAPRAQRRWLVAAGAAAALLQPVMTAGALERLQQNRFDVTPFRHRIDNRVSIITVLPDPDVADAIDRDVVFGGGVYDGSFNTDPVHGTNRITRAYMMAALHPEPRRVLEIGLSSGSWATVVARHAAVHELISIDINPGYVEAIRHYPQVAGVLTDPKVRRIVDDGRRWLRTHPDETFDFILMNTTFHWRSHTTNLLSEEFFDLCRRHLRSGGVMYFNTTSSRDVLYTVAQVFPHVTTYENFAAASEQPFALTSAQRRANLLRFAGADGTPLLLSTPEHRALLERLSSEPLPDVGETVRRQPGLQRITDDNMATEFKRGEL